MLTSTMIQKRWAENKDPSKKTPKQTNKQNKQQGE